MICIFGITDSKIKTNDDYRKIIKKKIRAMQILFLVGIFTILANIAGSLTGLINLDSFLSGLCLGMGCGLITAAIIKIIQYRKILGNEERLKEERLKYTDERNLAITAKAVHSATFSVIILSYVAMLVGACFNRIIFFCFWLIIMAFMLIYFIFLKYYSRKM